MNRKPRSPLGALHPILFCVGMYVVALFFSVFICSSVFYALNQPEETVETELAKANMKQMPTVATASTAVLATAMK